MQSFFQSIIIGFICCFLSIPSIAQDNGGANSNLKIKVRDLDNKMRAAIWKKIEINGTRRQLTNLKGNENLSVNCNDEISIWGRRNNMTSIQSNKWNPIDSLVFYLGKKKNVPQDRILEGTIYLRKTNGEIIPARNISIRDSSKNVITTTDLLGRFTIQLTCEEIKLKLDFNSKDIKDPPVIDLTITTSDNDRAKIDVYVNDLGTEKDGE